jgi:hypothetical protein
MGRANARPMTGPAMRLEYEATELENAPGFKKFWMA